MPQITKKIAFFSLFSALVLLSACTDSGNTATVKKAPWVMELQVIPGKLTINPDKFYSKPFTVRAKYSNATVKNVSKTVQWVSEDTNLLDINKSGELIVTGKCTKEKCPVSLVGTDPDSGKSVRVTVNVKQHKTAKLAPAKKKIQHS